ncbi:MULTISPECIES: C1 family peptidase [unclassified Undibacterium]|uniref:C1 family peptidase n=1 Tax=unclassified Undibacterium TaxID=2630295 RepID=UPI002AC8B0A0|nr:MULTISPECIES: C1 family peptidase [unclassified Undibacterium]MEB0141210.1 C1 family peptidase [Undibacterium sp. CCC2.1]MEB0174274.1 C1 family peptidase [Undibacterium sp. CCC1.1]MEB0178208.1 C1 family peptidase [Undibacterium sp. CCC3.4]MEB0215388.1 C1 family peptidase [Undibacterium sp. 5I2]WPX42729.1 C1 family peptidase [Undibacterium sp. CCC3.4]
MPSQVNHEKEPAHASKSEVHGGHPGSGTSVLAEVAAPPVIQANGVTRKLAKTAQRPKPLARPELKIAAAGKALPVPPPAVSLRAKCPPVLDQDPIESCAAFAFTSALRFLHLRDGLDEPLSPLFCYYTTRVLTEGEQTNDDSGCKADAVVETLEQYGTCVESAWPYDTSKFAITPPTTAFDDAATRKLTKAYRVTTLRAMKVSIADGYPVPVAFPVAQSVGCGDDAVLSHTWRTGIFPIPSCAPDDATAGASGTSAGSSGASAGSAGTVAGSAGGAAGASGTSAGSSGASASSAGGSASSAGVRGGYAGGPVNDSFRYAPQTPIPDPAVGYHFVLAIGYDDTTGLVEIENSWGDTFGDQGYGYLPYALFGPTQDTLIADKSVLAEDPWTLRHQADEMHHAAAAK